MGAWRAVAPCARLPALFAVGLHTHTPATEPPTLKRQQHIPGSVDADGEQFYRIEGGTFDADDLITVTPDVSGATLFVYAAIGTPPSRDALNPQTWTFQFSNETSGGGEKEIVISSTEKFQPDSEDATLYVAVYAPPDGAETRFRIVHWTSSNKHGVVKGVDNTITIIVAALLGVCCCIAIGGALAFVVLKNKRDGAAAGGGGGGGGMEMHNTPPHGGVALSNDYPSAQPDDGFGQQQGRGHAPSMR